MKNWLEHIRRYFLAQRSNGRPQPLFRLAFESLEERRVFTAVPYGAAPQDLGEFMLGSVAVTPVFLESNGAIDPNTENWTSSHIAEVLRNIETGLEWWEDLLATKSSIHQLDFQIDTRFALTPFQTSYEGISRRSNDYGLYVSEFLAAQGYSSGSLDANMMDFNHAQRLAMDTNWAFTILVVPSVNDADGMFLSGGSFNRAFAFAGGLFMVVPSTRPASTFTHETGHMFWARDEYLGGSTYLANRGYYNTQNWNSADNPTPGFVQQPSIMASSLLLEFAYQNYVSSDSSLAMIGWQDSDDDGIFDVLDVPHRLTGSGYTNAADGKYHFSGSAVVQTLPNLNSSGLRNDISLNRIRELQYRIDGGNWVTYSSPNAYEVDLEMVIDVPPRAETIEIRAIDTETTVTSNVFRGRIGRVDSTPIAGINGSVWIDGNSNGQRDPNEFGLAGWTINVLGPQGQAIDLDNSVEPDNYNSGAFNGSEFSGVTLTGVGTDTDGRIGAFADTNASTGTKLFRIYSIASTAFTSAFNSTTRRLRIDFASPVTSVSIDAIGASSASYGRLEAFNASGALVARYTTESLANGVSEKMTVQRGRGDIAYVIASGHRNSLIRLDALNYGVTTSTVTDARGLYQLPYLPAGNYSIQVTQAPGYRDINGSSQQVSLAAGSALMDIDFGFETRLSPWWNASEPNDVNNDGIVSPVDVVLIINAINAGGSRTLTGSNVSTPPFIDVTGDEILSPLDVIRVINFINERAR